MSNLRTLGSDRGFLPCAAVRSEEPATPSSNGSGARWFVVQTQPHAELRAIANLERQGYRVFCPQIRKTVRHARRVKQVRAPLFPGYLFIRIDIAREPWRRVNGTFGVSRLVTQGEVPMPVPHGIVETIRARMLGDGVIDWPNTFALGQSVRITDGPFTDFVGTLAHLDASGRVRVLLDMLGRTVPVELHHGTLTAAA